MTLVYVKTSKKRVKRKNNQISMILKKKQHNSATLPLQHNLDIGHRTNI